MNAFKDSSLEALFVATINRTLASFVTAIVGAEYVFRMLPRGTHQWSKFVKPEEIISPLTRSDMTLIKTSGISVNPFGPRFRLTRYMGVNYMLAFKKDIRINVSEIRIPNIDVTTLSKKLRKDLRSDHAGETGAVMIYKGFSRFS